ncbi:CG30 [Urbanus proteus nucleopolyhedrovirus]|uniref:CG30 n=1 Tax=Urbanus proteus nucleopolyhedrovirus TaxID=1675866 RepID=A0A161CD16_9ABAC|nr:CG30 [Urbanus proteus nucleopolyhedrovirus]AKR17371.1 CG30 [Urbanus proteus nucleopolyhedrovirus]
MNANKSDDQAAAVTLQCTICYEKYEFVKLKNYVISMIKLKQCQHSLCLRCAINLINNNVVKCPLCRTLNRTCRIICAHDGLVTLIDLNFCQIKNIYTLSTFNICNFLKSVYSANVLLK